MAIEHNVIPDGERHEPKGLSSATAGQVYVASGSDVGVWGKPLAANTTVADAGSYYTGADVETVLQELGPKVVYLTGVLADISSASSILIPLPANCVVSRIESVLGGAIASADAELTITRGGDSAELDTLTVAFSSSAEGDVDTVDAAANQTVVKATHKYLKVATDGGSTNAVPAYITITITI